MSLLTDELVAGRVVLHFKFEDYFIRIESVRRTKDTDGHDLLHLASLVPRKSFLHLLYLQECLLGQGLLEGGLCWSHLTILVNFIDLWHRCHGT